MPTIVRGMTSGSGIESGDVWQLFELAASQDESLSSYLQRILDRCAEWFHASTASIFLQEEGTDEYRLAAVGGAEPQIPKGATIRRGSGVAGLTLETGETLLINDPSEHPLLTGRLTRRLASSIVVPLGMQDGDRFGVLNLSRKAGQPPFTAEDASRVASLARQVALAVANARLMARTSEAMRDAKRAGDKLEAVFRSVGVALFVVDPDGNVTDANLQAHQMVEERAGDLRALAASVTTALGVSVTAALKAASGGEKFRDRAHDKTSDRSFSVVASPLPSGGATVAIEETTAHERASREMSRMARLAEIGQMTAAIAHEIRNPLTGIRGAAQMIEHAPDCAGEFAAIIEDEVVKLNMLCEEFLEFARPLAIKALAVRLDQLATQIADRVAGEFAERGVSLRVEIEAEAPTITGDALRLEQVLRNLLRNAMQACSVGGEVTLAVKERGFVVSDTGFGIEPERLETLFTPFFTTKADGTGLGLSNVKKIIDAHKGQIDVQSEVGKGTRFEVTLS
jgi:signal transduction histidine kinase